MPAGVVNLLRHTHANTEGYALRQAIQSVTAPTQVRSLAARDYATTVLNASPSGYWRLDEASGSTAHDLTVNVRHGTYQSGTTQGVHGALQSGGDNAVYRATAGSTVDVAHASAWNTLFTGAFTLECWTKVDTLENIYAAQLIRKGTVGTNDAVALYLSGSAAPMTGPARPGQIHLWAGLNQTGGGAVWTLLSNYSPAITLGGWHHVAATYSSTAGGTIYLDGVANTTLGPQQLGTLNITNTSVLQFGSVQATSSLDEVALYNTILSAATIQNHADANLMLC